MKPDVYERMVAEYIERKGYQTIVAPSHFHFSKEFELKGSQSIR
jgi:hypothetical protein